jgi:DNA-binding NarL/FixJ family response regulator
MHNVKLLRSGIRNQQITHSLTLSVKTIETHRENIKHKLGLNCSRDLVEVATKYVELTFLPPKTLFVKGKRKVVRFPAA